MTVRELRKKYPIGTYVELVRMDDVQAPLPGTKGHITGVDDVGSIMVAWETGSSLSLIPNVDEWKVISEPSEGVECMRIKTPIGVLLAERKADPYYPGLVVHFEGADDGVDACVVIEYDTVAKRVYTVIYDNNHDEPIASYPLENIPEKENGRKE